MRDFMERLKEGFFSTFERDEFLAPSLRILRQRKAVREVLNESKATGRVVGVYSAVLGEGMFLVCVEEITTHDAGEAVTFKPYDMNGVLLIRNEIALNEIKSVCPFESFYINPLSLNTRQYA